MSPDRLSQDSKRDVVSEAGQSHVDDQRAQLGGWPLDRPFPVLLTPADLRQVFQIREAYYFKLQALGRFTRFEAPSVLGAGRGVRRAVRYSGETVRDFLRHEPTHARTFGAARGPRRRPVQLVPQRHPAAQAAAGRQEGQR